MKGTLTNPLVFCVLAFAQSAFADFTHGDSAKALASCPSGSSFIGVTVYGKTADEARGKAKTEISRNIISQVKSKTSMSNESNESNGILEESGSFSDESEIESNATLIGVQEIEPPKQKSGEYELKGYICRTYAAKPFLNSLNEQAGRFKNAVLVLSNRPGKKEAWENVVSIYKTLKDLESVLKFLGYMDYALQKKYEADYSKAEKEYEAFAEQSGRAVHLAVSGSEYVAEELGAALQKADCNCSIVGSISEADYAVSVKAKLNRCGKPEYGITYCFANATVTVKNSKTDKNIPVQIPEASGGWPSHEPKRAIEEAFKELTESIAQELSKEIKR